MKYATINERAAALATTFVVGDAERMRIETLYTIINTAMQDAYRDGYRQAEYSHMCASPPVFEEDEAIDGDTHPWDTHPSDRT